MSGTWEAPRVSCYYYCCCYYKFFHTVSCILSSTPLPMPALQPGAVCSLLGPEVLLVFTMMDVAQLLLPLGKPLPCVLPLPAVTISDLL